MKLEHVRARIMAGGVEPASRRGNLRQIDVGEQKSLLVRHRAGVKPGKRLVYDRIPRIDPLQVGISLRWLFNNLPSALMIATLLYSVLPLTTLSISDAPER